MSTSATAVIRPDYTPHARAERLIAVGRFVLAFSSHIAIYLEPSTPARYQRPTYSLLLTYTAYALVMALVAWRSPVPSRGWRLFSHALDLVLFSVFVYLTEGPASPFFLYFVFSLFCATLRFSWRGILATGLMAMATYGAMAVVASINDPQFESSRVLIREAYLGVIAALLVYLGVHQQRLRGEMASLAAWPRELAGGIDDVLRGALAHAASSMNAQRVLLMWEEREEPWVHVARWWRGDFRLERVPPGTFEPVAAAARNTSVFVRAGGEPMLVYDPSRSEVRETAGHALDVALRTRYGIDAAILVFLESEALVVQMIVPDLRNATADELALAYIVGRLLLATLDQYFFVQQVRQTASAEERLRISRDLHDGIVQSLGGVGLQLQALRNDVGSHTPAGERLSHVQRVIEHDQRELRNIVRELRPHDARDGRAIVEGEVHRMRERYALEWGMEVDVGEVTPPPLSQRLAHELCRIVNESLANAARHGGATRARIRLSASDGLLRVQIDDNGRGFPFAGRHDLAALTELGVAPRSLQERTAALGGSLAVESSENGAVIDIALPLPEEGAV